MEGLFGAKTILDKTVSEEKLSEEVQLKLNAAGSGGISGEITSSNVIDQHSRTGYNKASNLLKGHLDGISVALESVEALLKAKENDCGCLGTLTVTPLYLPFTGTTPMVQTVTVTASGLSGALTYSLSSELTSYATATSTDFNATTGGTITITVNSLPIGDTIMGTLIVGGGEAILQEDVVISLTE